MLSSKSHDISAKLRDIIIRDGAISFADFMNTALYDPGAGYYSAADSAVFGKEGDFITAPEMSPVFARCLAAQCAELLKLLPDADILEIGAGSGKLAYNLLSELQQLDCMPRRYFIQEISPVMRQRQRQLLGSSYGKSEIEWVSTPPPFTGVVLANEVIDALPFHSLVLRGGKWWQRLVAVAANGVDFEWQEAPLPDSLRPFVPELAAAATEYADGYLSECRSNVGSWLQDIGRSLRRGLLLCIDYGYPRQEYLHPQRSMGTMLCHYRHQADDDPLRDVGQKDITASVDFSALADEAVARGFELCGYTTQAGFMLSMGVDKMLNTVEERRQLGDLLYHGAMGERFKVIALGKEPGDLISVPCTGFSMLDHRWRL